MAQNTTITGVASSASSVTIAAANTFRRGMSIYNDSTAILYLRFGAAAAAISSGNFSVEVPANSYFEVPFAYQGEVRGIWAAANGYANVTEFF